MFKYTRKAATYTTVLGLAGLGLYFVNGRDARTSAQRYLFGPAVRAVLDGEQAHRLAIEVFKFPGLAPQAPRDWDETHDPARALQVTLFRGAANPKVQPLVLQNPVGIAAGFDKNGDAIETLYNLGFAWVEVGSVTPLPQPGNPKPRVFRLDRDDAVINRYGFNSDGHAAVLARLRMREDRLPESSDNFAGRPHRALGVNLGKNKTGDEVGDYVKGVDTFGPHADILIVNVSSPNTPGLRDLQSEDKLADLLTTLVARRDALPRDALPPIVVKIAPDLTAPEIQSIAAAVKRSKVDGVIVSNTTVERPASLRSPADLVAQAGGLSGAPVKPFSIQALKTLRKELGPGVTIIGCGGIASGADALDFARAGADFVQLYTSLVYKGPGVATDVKEGILAGLDGKKWSDIVGSDL